MKNADKASLSEKDQLLVDENLLKGAAYRATILYALFGAASIIYGFQTHEVISQYLPDVTMWDNIWPRMMFNSLPCLVLAFLNERSKISAKTKVLIWAIGYPLIFLSACMIYVWPIILTGNPEAYLYFHAANMFCTSISLLLVAPAVKLLIVQIIAFTLTFYLPVHYFLESNPIIQNLFVNDSINSLSFAIFCAVFLHSLRQKLSVFELKIKERVAPFLGKNLVSAIYDNNLKALEEKTSYGLILSIDLRGYTNFKQQNDKKLTADFMREYHANISRKVAEYGGFLHKSNGDGHLISFGIINENDSLEEIPGLGMELLNAELRSTKHYGEHAVRLMENLIVHFESLKDKYHISSDMRIGAALAAGNIDIKLHGDGVNRSEVDLDGEAVFKSARLEAYTKLMGIKLDEQASIFIISPEIVDSLKIDGNFDVWKINEEALRVRDFPEIEKLYFKKWKLKEREKIRFSA